MSARIGSAMKRCGALLMTVSIFCSVQVRARSDDAPAAAPTAGKITYADLTHETYTATHNLNAAFAFPADGAISPTIATRVVVDTTLGAGIELRVNDEIVPLTRVGRHTASTKTASAEFEYFGVVLKPGPNRIVATAVGANGLRGAATAETVSGPGMPATLKGSLQGKLVADGKTVTMLDVRALDRWNDPALAGSPVTVKLVHGDASFAGRENAQPAASASAAPSDLASPPGGAGGAVFEAQLGVGGLVGVPILPGLTPGDVTLQISSGDLTTTQTFYMAPYVRAPFVNGLLSVGTGVVPIGVDGDGRDDAGGARRLRGALFASGRVGKTSLMTLAYESQNALSPLSSFGPFVDDPNERPYQTFGDSSVRASGYRSNDRLYARLDSGRDSAMWGQFDATTGDENAVGAFRQLLSGAKIELASKDARAHLTAFGARNDVGYVSTTLAVTGLSNLARPLQPDIVVGSDYLSLASLDRRTGAVVAQSPLIRNVDYTIDYATGVLRFINVPLPFDENFNPQVLEIHYQYRGVGVNSRTTGADARFQFGKLGTTRLNLGYVNDATGAGNFSMLSQTLSGKLSGGGWTLSHATSDGASPAFAGQAVSNGTHGGALAFGMNDRVGRDQIDLQYQDTGNGFSDPFGGISNPGFTNYRAAWSRRTSSSDTLVFEADGQKNRGLGNDDSQNNVSLLMRKTVAKSLSLVLGLAAHAQHNAPLIAAGQGSNTLQTNTPQSSTDAHLQLGFDWKATKKIDLRMQHDQALGGNDALSTQPAQTTAELSYAFDGKGKMFVRELLSAAPTTVFAQAAGTLGAANLGTRTTQIGFERALGPATTIDSEYLMTNSGNATDIYSALGVQQKFSLGKRLGGNLLFQRANATGAGAAGFAVYGGSIAYTDTKDFRAALSYQSRTGVGGGTTLSGGFTGHMGPNLSVLGTIAQAIGNGNRAGDDRITLAYRPAGNDRLVSLVGYSQISGTSALLADRTDVLSFEELFRPWSGFELAGRIATKLDGGGYYAAHTALAGIRVRQNVGTRFDLGGELRSLSAANIPGARATDFAVEAGYALGTSTRLAAGYNFSGSVDPTLTGHPQRKGFYLTFTTMVDRVFGWGAH